MTKSNKIIISIIGCIVVCVVALSIFTMINYKNYQYINQNTKQIHVTDSSDNPAVVNEGEYQFVDYKSEGKELEFKKPEETESYNLDMGDKHINIDYDSDVDIDNVVIDPPENKEKFSIFKSFRSDAVTKVIVNPSHKGDMDNVK